MQIGAMLRLGDEGVDDPPEVCHPLELLDESYRRADLRATSDGSGVTPGRS
jgi:hypothetical protein